MAYPCNKRMVKWVSIYKSMKKTPFFPAASRQWTTLFRGAFSGKVMDSPVLIAGPEAALWKDLSAGGCSSSLCRYCSGECCPFTGLSRGVAASGFLRRRLCGPDKDRLSALDTPAFGGAHYHHSPLFFQQGSQDASAFGCGIPPVYQSYPSVFFRHCDSERTLPGMETPGFYRHLGGGDSLHRVTDPRKTAGARPGFPVAGGPVMPYNDRHYV